MLLSTSPSRPTHLDRPTNAGRGSRLLLACILFMVGCNSPPADTAHPRTLTISVIPGESKTVLRERFSPLVEYLERELGIPCELVLHDSYEELQRAFTSQQIDLAWLGGYTFINVHRSHGAVPLVSRDRDLRFTSYFLVRAGEPDLQLADFRGQRLAFGSRLSTSGHLMPRHFLEQWNLPPEEFFSEVRYTGAHNRTVAAVRAGDVDVGAVSGPVIDAMFQSGQLSTGDVRVLQETPPYLDYVWACQASLPDAWQIRIRDALMNLTRSDELHAQILERLRADYFVPVSVEEFRDLQGIIDELLVVVQ